MNLFWSHYNAIAQSVPTVVLTTPSQLVAPDQPKNTSFRDRLHHRSKERARGKRLAQKVLENLDPNGPNILLVWALRKPDVLRSELLDPVWDRFSHKVLSIVDNLQPEHVSFQIQGRFDRITSFCGDLAQEFEQATAIPTLYFPPHSDTLNFHSTQNYRPIDLCVVGRRRSDLHVPIHQHFNAPGRNRISMDFVSRTRNFSSSSEEEFSQLISAYSRSKMTFCFDPGDVDRFKTRSPLTERWVHAWSSGSTVIGKAPTGHGTVKQMDWPEATIDLPEEPQDAIAVVEALLDDEAGMERRRYRNVEETMRRHDTRHRLRQLLTELDLPLPQGLTADLNKLENFSTELAKLR